MLKKFKDWLEHVDQSKRQQVKLSDVAIINHPYYMNSAGENFKVTKGSSSDINDILLMQKESYGSLQWRRPSLEQDLIYNRRSIYLVMRDKQGEPVAFMGAWMTDDEVHISNLCVRPKYQKQGIASFLVNEIGFMGESLNRSIYTLEVRVSNEKAIRLYGRLGFEIVEYKENYYFDNQEDAYDMRRQLNSIGDSTYDSE